MPSLMVETRVGRFGMEFDPVSHATAYPSGWLATDGDCEERQPDRHSARQSVNLVAALPRAQPLGDEG
ncbi:hypothetical protein, partial [Enhygromyxa salina]|uniref:hypothetical protein n=1 Tax=Enhygromyxa salina TaxID=215803 RepID=UPI001969E225